MKKLLTVVAILMALLLVFVACEDPATNPEETTDPIEQTSPETPTTEPGEDTTDPGEDTTDPGEDTTAPGEDTTDPGEDTTDPGEDTTEPDDPPPPEVDPAEPIGVYTAEQISTITGGDPSNIKQDCVSLVDGYLHVVPIGPDPYWYPFSNVAGARFVAIRYRTDATGADIQMYIGSSGAGPSNDDTMLRQAVVADSQWHLAIFDTQEIIEKGLYDGSKVSYFRFDALEAGYMLDENGQPYKPDGQNYARYTLPEGCSIDIAYIAFFNTAEYAQAYDFEMYKAPMWDADKAVLTHQSFDQLYVGAGDATNGEENLFAPGQSASWDGIANLATADILTYWGWVGIKGEVGQFGYQIGYSEPIYNDEWTVAPEQPVIDAAVGGGADTGSRMKIRIDLTGLEGEYTVRTLYKTPDGVVVCLREFRVIIPVVSHQNGYTTDIGSNFASAQDDINLRETELSQLFEKIWYGAAVDMFAKYNDGNPFYNVTHFTSMHTQPNGWYAFTVNVTESAGNEGQASIFVRGIQPASIEGHYFGQDGHDGGDVISMGGSGIYLNPLATGKLRINIKTYVDGAYVPNVYYVTIDSNEITVADNGSVVTILAGGKKVATIEIIGTKDYGIVGKNGEVAADDLAEKAILTLADGTVITLENACVAAKIAGSDVGVATRTGTLNFNRASLQAYNTVEIPEEFFLPEVKENVALGATVTADSVENDTNIPSNATDGNDGTRWGATQNGFANMIVDLGAVYELTDIITLFENASWNYTIAISVDGEAYTVIHEGEPHGATSVKIHSDEPVEVRYIKYTRLEDGNEGAHWFSIYEVIAHGTLKEGQEEAPATDYNVPQDAWTVTGHKAGITPANDPSHGPMVAAGGIETGALLHQGYIGVGEIDLSKYSKVIVYIGIDNSQVTIDHHAANAANRLMLTSADQAMTMSPTDDVVIASVDYAPCGWAITAFEIDLTGVDYNGPVYFTYDTLPGTFMLVGSIEFIV